jgi:hypothetical protein
MTEPEGASVPFVDTGSYPTRAGNKITPWIDGEPAFRRLCEAIEAARASVWATVTFMWPSFRMPDGRGTALDVLEPGVPVQEELRLGSSIGQAPLRFAPSGRICGRGRKELPWTSAR